MGSAVLTRNHFLQMQVKSSDLQNRGVQIVVRRADMVGMKAWHYFCFVGCMRHRLIADGMFL